MPAGATLDLCHALITTLCSCYSAVRHCQALALIGLVNSRRNNNRAGCGHRTQHSVLAGFAECKSCGPRRLADQSSRRLKLGSRRQATVWTKSL